MDPYLSWLMPLTFWLMDKVSIWSRSYLTPLQASLWFADFVAKFSSFLKISSPSYFPVLHATVLDGGSENVAFLSRNRSAMSQPCRIWEETSRQGN